jgi:hypothetical protein
MTSLVHSCRQRGFNLIEAAIVLGVIGLVIGGIWTAAASTYEKMKWAEFEKGVLYYITLIDERFGPDAYQGSNSALEPWMESYPVPSGWTGRRSDPGNPATFHPIDPYGNALYGMIMSWGPTPVYSFGFPWATLSRDFCTKFTMLMFNRVNRSYPVHTYTLPNSACVPAPNWTYGDFYDGCCPSEGSMTFFMRL